MIAWMELYFCGWEWLTVFSLYILSRLWPLKANPKCYLLYKLFQILGMNGSMSFFKLSQSILFCLFPILNDNYCVLVIASPKDPKLTFGLVLSIFCVVLLGIPQFWYMQITQVFIWIEPHYGALIFISFFSDPFR